MEGLFTVIVNLEASTLQPGAEQVNDIEPGVGGMSDARPQASALLVVLTLLDANSQSPGLEIEQ
jgi:hypothetical protein